MGSKMDAVTNGVGAAVGQKIIVSPLGMWESPVANAVVRVARKGLKSLAMRRGLIWVITSAGCVLSALKKPQNQWRWKFSEQNAVTGHTSVGGGYWSIVRHEFITVESLWCPETYQHKPKWWRH